MGHSMGGAAVVEEVLRDPTGIDCVVLVSPAVVAFSFRPPTAPGAAEPRLPPWKRLGTTLGSLAVTLGSTVVGIGLLIAQPLLVWVLRSLVRTRWLTSFVYLHPLPVLTSLHVNFLLSFAAN